jgi:hypothetical protein
MKKLLLTLFAVAAISLIPSQADAFAGGDGSAGDPFQISSCAELADINSALDANYILVSDIDCSGVTSFITGSFTGVFDGQGFKISNVFLSSGNVAAGLFFVLDGDAEIKNVGLEDVDITGTGLSTRTGALVGFMNSGSTATISNSYSTGSVTSTNSQTAGGLIGINRGTISNSYSTVDVTTPGGNAGGLVGQNISGIVLNSYSTGAVGESGGGLLKLNTGTTTDSFWDTETSGTSTSAGGTGKTTAEMKDAATFTDTATVGLTTAWDFVDNPNDDAGDEDIWDIDGVTNDGYPFLTIFVREAPDAPTALSATAISDTQINLSWTAPASDGGSAITGYQIERKVAAGSFATLVADTGTTSITHEDTGLTAETLYTYRVSALNAVGTSTASGEAFATTDAAPEPEVEESGGGGGGSSSRRTSTASDDEDEEEGTSDEVTTLEDLIATLRELLQELLAQGGTLPSGAVQYLNGALPAPGYARDLTEGDRGSDVTQLQLYLIARNIGPAAQALAVVGATGYFGPLTQAALAEFQASVGIVPSVGYFGPITRAHIGGR